MIVTLLKTLLVCVLVLVASIVLFPYPTGQWLEEVINVLTQSAQYNAKVSTRNGVLLPVTNEIEKDPVPLQLLAGSIPDTLDGVYLRVGPNELTGHAHGRMSYHLFDGHGMIHVTTIKGGKAWHTRSWLKTPRWTIEHEKQRDVLGRLGTFYMPWLPLRLLTQWIKQRAFGIPPLECGPANTNIQRWHDGRLFALHEGSLPFEFSLIATDNNAEAFRVESIGYESFGGQLDESVTAHPRIDPQSGATVFASYNPSTYRFPVGEILGRQLVSFQKVLGRHHDSDLQQQPDSQRTAIGWAHDAAVTPNYVIIPDGGSVFSIKNLEKNVFIDLASTLGFTVVPRNNNNNATTNFQEQPFVVTSDLASSIVHIATAWEMSDSIVVAAPQSKDLKGIPVHKDTLQYNHFVMSKMTLPKHGGTLTLETIESPECSPEFPRINPRLDGGYQVRFAFASCIAKPGDAREGAVNFSGWAKFDFEFMRVAAYIPIPQPWVVGEMAPIPKHPTGDPRTGGSAEEGSDAVWLIGTMINVETLVSQIVIYDGEVPSEEPVAVLGSSERIPAGFHSQFYYRSELQLEKRQSGDQRSMDDDADKNSGPDEL